MAAYLFENIKVTRNPLIADLFLINSSIVHGYSFLAFKCSGKNLVQAVCKSNAGYYIGCTDGETGEPFARDSVEYWTTEAEAAQHLENKSWTQRLDP